MKSSIIVASLVLICSMLSFAETIRISSSEWPPWNSKHLIGYGITSEIVSDAFSKQQVRVEYYYQSNWSDAYRFAKDGRYDASVSWIYTDERAKEFIYSSPISYASNHWFYLKSNPKSPFNWDDLGSMKQLTIGVTRGYSYGREVDALRRERSVTFQEEGTDLENFRKLLAGEIDLFPSNLCVGYYLLRTSLIDEMMRVAHSPEPFDVFSLHLIFNRVNPENPRLAKVFEAGLQELNKGDGIKKKSQKCFYSLRGR
ncbi:substrate-binding periplasmic protein [Dongshaea marina]|uniref:substrate-binding periplasmic protein n=1 Tax=Dongshaea marina TaxID=2047966 RepID=UPI000D3EA5C2|nr:transporter substrate-binding domain-containing protein [Dongshaea marina]